MSNFRSSFHTELSQLFYYDILYRRSNYFFLIGKTDKWNESDIPPSVPINSQSNDLSIISNMVYAKRISPSDVSLVCRNWLWQLGVVFEKWDHTKDMSDKMFFCLTSDYKVYKCLDNNNGAFSSIEPTGNSTQPIRLEDGYLWKYMYTIPSFKRSKFITASHIPVQRALTDTFFNRGSLEGAVVLNQGTGYTDTVTSSIVVTNTGNTTGTGATGTATVGTSLNAITNVSVTTGGSNYTRGVLIDITSGSGSGSGAKLLPVIQYTATFDSVSGLVTNDILVSENREYIITNITGTTVTFKNKYDNVVEKVLGIPLAGDTFTEKDIPASPTYSCVSVTNGIVDSVFIVDGGIGYSGVSITFRVGGANILPKINTQGSLTGVIILDKGIGYITEPPLLLTSAIGSPSGKFGNSTALIEAVIYRGQIENVAIFDPGKNYDAGTDVAILINGDGEGAAMTPIVYNGSIIDVILENPGSGYTFTINTVTQATGEGSGAVIQSIIETSDYESDQSIVEQTAVVGAIYSIEIVDGGNNYTNSTTIQIVGDGTGATAECVVSSGEIISVIMTNFGSGYTYATVNINDPGDEINPEGGAGAELYAIMPPRGGHGFDAVTELHGDTINLVSSLRNEIINEVIESQDFRQFAIIKNPKDRNTFLTVTSEKELLLFTGVFQSTSTLEIDDVLVQGSTEFLVVGIDNTTVYLSKITESGTLLIGSSNTLYNKADPSEVYTCSVVTSTPSLNKYSGSLIYTSNEGSFVFSQNQGLTIKSLIKF